MGHVEKIIRIALMLILVAGLYFVQIKENKKLFWKKFVFFGLLKLKFLVHPFYKLVFFSKFLLILSSLDSIENQKGPEDLKSLKLYANMFDFS